ncbi:MAG: response regulator [Acidobacteriia bacterium]|nr:response regulator [Terriglobia bacterium]
MILDLNLPKLDGFAVLQRYPRTNSPPVVILSGSPFEGDRERALALGARDYASSQLVSKSSLKPFGGS